MTAATTIVGLIPLAWGHGGLFNMKYFPMARTVMGGLMASTALTLVVLPTYYTLFDDLASRLGQAHLVRQQPFAARANDRSSRRLKRQVLLISASRRRDRLSAGPSPQSGDAATSHHCEPPSAAGTNKSVQSKR